MSYYTEHTIHRETVQTLRAARKYTCSILRRERRVGGVGVARLVLGRLLRVEELRRIRHTGVQ